MRIWSLHPKYLDAKGLVALWRETLLAKHVLEGRTKGYGHHPQLHRFKQADEPLDRINQYLATVHDESLARNYNFDPRKIDGGFDPAVMLVTRGQIQFETQHLLHKLMVRDKEKYKELIGLEVLEPNPMFEVIEGDVEAWEIIRGPSLVQGHSQKTLHQRTR
ncbi:MAG TPA: pyrimidine dimer DNA glycosylase/endonuclease V [Flavobacteriales bacterium]|nr:pyrimidine dimer DNA glycosylase/endonuclease V [Flavobacteriales bacterium]